MGDQTILFTPGTLVWIKINNGIWWPSKVVDPTTSPQDLQDYMALREKAIAMVYFERDDKYDIVMNKNNLFLYSCPKKMEFVEKGYNFYVKKNKGSKIQSVHMDNFLNDVISFEKEIGGDVNIFEQFEKKKKEKPPTEARKELIKKLFVSSKKMKNNAQNKKLKNRRSNHPPKNTSQSSKPKSGVKNFASYLARKMSDIPREHKEILQSKIIAMVEEELKD